MTRRWIPIRNKDELALERRLAPFIETCAAFLVGSGNLRKMKRYQSTDAPSGDWIVMRDETGAGFAVWGKLEGVHTTPMRVSLNRVHTLRAIARACRSTNEVPLVLVEDSVPPSEWAFFKVSTVQGVVWCALSEEPPRELPSVRGSESVPTVRVRVLGEMSNEIPPAVGGKVLLSALMVRIPEFFIDGRLIVRREESMAIEVLSTEGARSEVLPAVRVDLGELEISLADVLSLRVGSVIKLGPMEDLKCLLRIGSSTLAEGELRDSDDGRVIEITRVL